MSPEAVKLGQVLLSHHKVRTTALPPGRKPNPSHYVISYSDLCAKAGAPFLVRSVGRFLQEIAEWCAARDLPPLNSLAVNHATGMPGDGYDGAGGFTMADWARDVDLCIRCSAYPAHFP